MPEISMNPRAKTLIAELDLHPHPKGGFYRETFRSGSRVLYGEVILRYQNRGVGIAMVFEK
jgi:predicted cupin superfamily sugar epimerase